MKPLCGLSTKRWRDKRYTLAIVDPYGVRWALDHILRLSGTHDQMWNFVVEEEGKKGREVG